MLKKVMDRCVGVILLVIISPVLLLLWFLVRYFIGKPAIFRQLRPGLNTKPFVIYKFRTMTEERGPDGLALPDSRRLTKFGQFLRRSSLDELPELWNVTKGDMSLVGPRPLLMEYLPLYSDLQLRRHDVLPGITGWAQVNGRNAISWEEKFAYDVWYVDNLSFFLDMKIILMTLKKVISGEGISADDHVTTSRWTGINEFQEK